MKDPDADRQFETRNPYRIDLPDGTHIRFASPSTAARSALYHGREVWDESTGREINLRECRALASGVRPRSI